MDDKWTKEEICTHLGDEYERFHGAVIPPIFQNSLFVVPNMDSSGTDNSKQKYVYTRINNPTTEVAEKKIAALEEGASANCFGSGMAAITASILNCVSGGSHIVAMKNIYPGTRKFLDTYITKFGIETTYIQDGDPMKLEDAIRPNTKLIYLESPSYLFFEMVDIEGITKLAASRGIKTIIDNTWSTPMFQNPLKMGVDIVVHSASKYLGGHSDIVAGVAVGSREIMESISGNERELLGACMDPHQAWLLTRGIRTLPVRMKQHQESTLQIARYLETRPNVLRVMYPGLESHPQYNIGKKQMTGYSGLLSFVIDTDSAGACKFANYLEHFQIGPSWGGFESLAVYFGEYTPKNSGRTDARGQIIRISVGLENAATLLADLEAGLQVI